MPDAVSTDAPLRVLVAGGGLGGLFAAICLRNAGADVVVLERTARYRPFGGPIQLASNGVSVIKATSESLFRRVHDVSRPFWRTTSGIRDGLKGNWMFTFGAITELPDEEDLPFSICVDRSDLQEALLEEIRETEKSPLGATVEMDAAVVKYANRADGAGVDATLADGRVVTADVLVGADGIWSEVRAQMFGEPGGVKGAGSTASFTGYKLFSGLPLFKPYYYEDVGYSAFIGPDHYFVTCPDRAGRVQWYGFIKATAPNSPDVEDPSAFLQETLKGWAPEVLELIRATDPGTIEQRDLWDRFPSVGKSWADGHATLLGDSCHATMPNIGQGAGLAFEDGFELAKVLEDVRSRSEIPAALRSFYRRRIARTAAAGPRADELGGDQNPDSRCPSARWSSTSSARSCRWCSARSSVLLLVLPAEDGRARRARAAEEMRARHKKEAEEAWADAEARGVDVAGVENTHENPALEVLAN